MSGSLRIPTAAAKIQKALQRKIEPVFKEMNKVMDRENDRIDTTENYHREQARCSKWQASKTADS